MRLVPVTSPFPSFTLRCAVCGEQDYAARMAADLDGPPFEAYICARHQTAEIFLEVAQAAQAAFKKLPPATRHRERVRILGEARTAEIEARERATNFDRRLR